MATVVGVRFREVGKIYSFDPGDLVLRRGDHVIAETAKGYEYGTVVLGNHPDLSGEEDPERKQIVRRATEEDDQKVRDNKAREKDALMICRKKVEERKLDMKVIAAEYTFDDSKLLFFFTADGRVDFRDLVKDLAAIFHMRIELRQVGVRDETRIIGGMGPCGRPLCCHSWLPDFVPVSIKMAKEQNLSLNPTKISGQCGRLMCCLKYEQDFYEETLKKLPRVGKDIMTPDGVGLVTEINVLREKVKVKVSVDDDFEIREYSVEEVRRLQPGERSAKPAQEDNEEKNEPEAEVQAPKDNHPRYPHKKREKNMNTDEFIKKNLRGEEEQA